MGSLLQLLHNVPSLWCWKKTTDVWSAGTSGCKGGCLISRFGQGSGTFLFKIGWTPMARQGLISAAGALTRRAGAVGNHPSPWGPYICHNTNPIFRGLGPVENRTNRICDGFMVSDRNRSAMAPYDVSRPAFWSISRRGALGHPPGG